MQFAPTATDSTTSPGLSLKAIRRGATAVDGAVDTAAPARIRNVSRRGFLKASGGLALAVQLGPFAAADALAQDAPPAPPITPNAFVQIGADGTVTVISKHLEMGQGIYTGLATLIADEMDADWSRVRATGAPADNKLYTNLLMGMQGTGGSNAIANSFVQMRQAGAAARAMLVAAAADAWKVPAGEITVANGVVRHAPSKRESGFGPLAKAAAAQPVPKSVTLKDPKDFKLIGKETLRRLDAAGKTNGTAVFTQDIKRPGMLVAVPAHPARFGSTVKRFDASKAKAVPGVVGVVQFAASAHSFGGVAVLATNTWAAKQGRDALTVEWDDSTGYAKGSEQILAQYREAAQQPGRIAGQRGDVAAALAKPARTLEAEYTFPYLAHASMEPLNCLVELDGEAGPGTCAIWNGEQFQTADQGAVAKFLGIAPEKITITQLYAGGSFGRRANPQADYVIEAVSIAKAARDAGIKAPVKMVWTREDDMRGGYYRPLNLHRARLAFDAQGKLQAWHVRLVGQSVLGESPFSGFLKDGLDFTSFEGQADLPYDVPNLQVESFTPKDVGVPIQWFRSVGHTHTAFSAECLIDEAASIAKQDPVAYRMALLAKHPRHRGVLALAAEKAGWSRPLAAGAAGEKRARGVAVHESFNTFVAQVAEITVKADGTYRVDRVVCAVDCGVAVNPDVIRAQMEGGIGFGLAAALHGAITLKDGAVEQSNFHDYPVLRINEMPKVEVHVVASNEKPTGVGEPGVPPVAPALANALFAATGKRLRSLPLPEKIA